MTGLAYSSLLLHCTTQKDYTNTNLASVFPAPQPMVLGTWGSCSLKSHDSRELGVRVSDLIPQLLPKLVMQDSDSPP